MTTLFLRLVVTGVSIWAATYVVEGMSIVPAQAPFGTTAVVLLGVAAVFTAVNAVVKPVLAFFSLPFILLTLGLFLVVINALMLLLTAWLTSFTNYGIDVDGFITALIGSIVISVVNWLITLVVPKV